MKQGIIHLVATMVWGIYGISVGTLTVVYGYSSPWAWITIVTAVVGNSAHLVSYAVSSAGVEIASAQTQSQVPLQIQKPP